MRLGLAAWRALSDGALFGCAQLGRSRDAKAHSEMLAQELPENLQMIQKHFGDIGRCRKAWTLLEDEDGLLTFQ